MLGHTFTIHEASGKVHERIFIQGNGGNVRGKGSHERMQLAIEQATNGQRTSVYEVRPGIVLGFNETAHGRSNEREIDLHGASIIDESVVPSMLEAFHRRPMICRNCKRAIPAQFGDSDVHPLGCP